MHPVLVLKEYSITFKKFFPTRMQRISLIYKLKITLEKTLTCEIELKIETLKCDIKPYIY
jgi:hypothetical protein